MVYLEKVTDVKETRKKGYLDDCIVEKMADWIMGVMWNMAGL